MLTTKRYTKINSQTPNGLLILLSPFVIHTNSQINLSQNNAYH